MVGCCCCRCLSLLLLFFILMIQKKNQAKGWPAHPLTIFYKDCMIIMIEIDDCRGYKKRRRSISLGWGEEMWFGVESYIERLDFHLNDGKQHFSLHHYIRIKEGICYLYQIKYMMYGANLTHAATLRAYIIFIKYKKVSGQCAPKQAHRISFLS